MDHLDVIALTGLRVFGRHGVYDFEREKGQDFVVDASLRLSTRRAAQTDDVRDTVHYGEVAERIAELVAGEPVALLETLAERIAADLLTDERIHSVDVTIHKPQAPIELTFADVSVTITRGRDGDSS